MAKRGKKKTKENKQFFKSHYMWKTEKKQR